MKPANPSNPLKITLRSRRGVPPFQASAGVLRMRSLFPKRHLEWDGFKKPLFSSYRHHLLVDLDVIDPKLDKFHPVSKWWFEQETPTMIRIMFKKEEDLILFKLAVI